MTKSERILRPVLWQLFWFGFSCFFMCWCLDTALDPSAPAVSRVFQGGVAVMQALVASANLYFLVARIYWALEMRRCRAVIRRELIKLLGEEEGERVFRKHEREVEGENGLQ
jgi:hypothetical protein